MEIADELLGWYRRGARHLPWRSADVTPWAVLVSEVMLQQTPVARVLPVYGAWLQRWPTPAALAAASPADAVRMWGTLGYPRRAIRLHECATVLVERHAGCVPSRVDALLTLPGIGGYTARAIAAFAFGQRQPVVDTNVRRVVTRLVDGQVTRPPTARDLAAVQALLPVDPRVAARVSVALMELGALICTARTPRCSECPLRARCTWRLAGAPAAAGPAARAQRFTGTDRQVRGLLLAVLRSSAGPVNRARLDAVWPDQVQRERALDGLLADGLAERRLDGRVGLPGEP